jgi:uncharacterized membrane protein HdeD (DUF308 family)
MKSLFNKYVWLQLILSILLLFGGSVIIAFAINNDTKVLENALNIVIAVILFLFGLFAILTAFIFETKKYVTLSLLYGSASIALGVFLCTKELVLLNYIIYLIAIFMIVVGAVELLKAIILTVKDRKQLTLIIISYVIAVLFITAGILAIVFRDKIKDVLNIVTCVLAGVLLLLAGGWELYLGIKALVGKNKNGVSKEKKKNKKDDQVVATQQEQPKEEIKEIDYTSNKIEQK